MKTRILSGLFVGSVLLTTTAFGGYRSNGGVCIRSRAIEGARRQRVSAARAARRRGGRRGPAIVGLDEAGGAADATGSPVAMRKVAGGRGADPLERATLEARRPAGHV